MHPTAGVLFVALLTCNLGAQQWLRPWCVGNGPADLYVNAGTVATFGTADIPLSVGYCASPTNPATQTGIRLRVDYEAGPMTWSYGGFFKLFVEFTVVDVGACTPYRELLVRVYARNSFHCNYVTVRNARVAIAGSSLEFPAASGSDTTYFADGTTAGSNLWQLVVPQQIVCPQTLVGPGCAGFSGTLNAVRTEWPLTAVPTTAGRRFTVNLSGPPGAVVLLYQAWDPLPFGVNAAHLPQLAGLFEPECFWFSPVQQLLLPASIMVPWAYVGSYAGFVALDANGLGAREFTVPDLTPFVGPNGYEDLLLQGVVLRTTAPPPGFGLTNAVAVFVHR